MLHWITRRRNGLRLSHRPESNGLKSKPANEPNGERLVFVGGAPRSGTTLLQHMLDSHPDIFGGPEFDCIPTIIQTWQRVVQAFDAGRITVFCTRPQIDRVFAGLIENLLLPAADANGTKLLSEKTPFNVLAFQGLLELLPQCRAIHIVRDPRAVVSSMLKVAERCRAKNEPMPYFIQDVEAAVRFTRDSIDAGLYAAKIYPDRVFTLRYEALVAHPAALAAQLCSFLNVSQHTKMLEPHTIKHPGQDELSKLDNGTWMDPALGIRAIEPSRVRAWADGLDLAHVETIESAFRDHAGLQAMGYQFN